MPFCNTICFDVLADVHKESCGKGSLPEIDDAIISEFSKIQLPPSGSNVKISAFEQSNVVYVRSAEIGDEIAYYKVLSDVMLHGKHSAKLMQMPHCGEIVIYKSSVQIVRAMVLNVDNPQAIYVVCVDYGNVEIITLDTLYECSPYLAGLPRYALPVLLRAVPRRFMSPNLRSMLYELDHTYTFVLKYSKRDFDFDKGMQRVILIESELNRSLNRLINTIVNPVEPSISEIGYKEDVRRINQISTVDSIYSLIPVSAACPFANRQEYRIGCHGQHIYQIWRHSLHNSGLCIRNNFHAAQFSVLWRIHSQM